MKNNLNDFNKIKASDNLKQRILNSVIYEEDRKVKKMKTYNNVKKKRAFAPMIAVILIAFSSLMVYGVTKLEYFKSYFGESIYLVKEDVYQDILTVKNDNYTVTLEAVLADDYRLSSVISIKANKKELITTLDSMKKNIKLQRKENGIIAYTYGVKELKQHDTEDTKYFLINTVALSNKLTDIVKLSVNEKLVLNIPTKSTLNYKTINIDSKYYKDSDYVPKKITVSQIGLMVEGFENKVQHQIPNPQVTLVFENNKKVVVWDGGPDEMTMTGYRDDKEQNNSTTVFCSFPNIVDVNKLTKVIVDNQDYIIQ
ncbi:DUF4179 domain-containing protein [Clostridium sp. 'deep sea']|uniref:DUF4179 domain-containing protein n=1 Tax=Clostridium sp. 'deep sea' TaxID=2779445 RepID=UPI0018968026|nr:DUF4179 domain-containing protein [Clostridium sp. 'deep sea']QOR35054.1 DUF4179 domain-containing protein [Clostridium sp. 'deep sea']